MRRLLQREARLVKAAARAHGSDRAADTRLKITLGGLVVKAGLRGADERFLLGVLTEAAKLEPGSAEYERLRRIGDAVGSRVLA